MKLTREMVEASKSPGFGCAIPKFRATLDEESAASFDVAINTPHHQLPAIDLHNLLVDCGFVAVPTVNQIKQHRTRTRSCKCPR